MKRNRIIKIIVFVIVASLLYFISEFFYTKYYYGHKVVWEAHKELSWILKDEYKTKINDIGATALGHRDKITFLNLDDEFQTRVTIWEIKSNIDFKDLIIDTNFSSNKIQLNRYEIVNKDGGGIVFTMNYNRKFDKSFVLGFNNFSKIKSTYLGENYIGVFGEDIFEFYIESDSKTDILVENNFEMPLMAAILYKKQNKIYLILLNGDYPFDEKIINILDLK